jgi:hypothetical protein
MPCYRLRGQVFAVREFERRNAPRPIPCASLPAPSCSPGATSSCTRREAGDPPTLPGIHRAYHGTHSNMIAVAREAVITAMRTDVGPGRVRA